VTDPKIIGCLITAKAAHRRTIRGVVLPPAPRSRNGALRITVDGKAPKPFNPDDGWTITIQAGPTYSHGDLPAEHLATRTMMRTEMRLQPADTDKDWIAWYTVRKGEVPLYPVADAAPMKALSPARAEAWAKGRTCQRCGDLRPRPLAENPDGGRHCGPCHELLAAERWTEQSRRAQAEAAAWARDILAEPDTLLLTHDKPWHATRLRIETVAGDLVFDGRLRNFDDLDWITNSDNYTPEQIQANLQKYEGTIGRTEFEPTATALADRRIIAWYDRDTWIEGHQLPRVEEADALRDRLALWSGIAPHRNGWWHPEPRFPWNFLPLFPQHKAHRELHRGGNPAAEISNLRTLLHLMAWNSPPTPTVPQPTTGSS
jgi:hypothetical protein